MRKIGSMCLLLLAGCASAEMPEGRSVIRPVPMTAASAEEAEDARYTIVKAERMDGRATAACETNDPMATRGPILRVPPPSMPNAATPNPLPYIPNLCPVTVKPAAAANVPAVLQRRETRIHEPQAQP